MLRVEIFLQVIIIPVLGQYGLLRSDFVQKIFDIETYNCFLIYLIDPYVCFDLLLLTKNSENI